MDLYKTTKECRNLTGIKIQNLVEFCKNNNVDYYFKPTSRDKYRININSLLKYIEDNNIPMGAFNNIKPGTYTLIGGYAHQYAANNDTGDIVDFDYKKKLTPSPNGNKEGHNGKPYYQVTLIKNGKRIFKLVHRLIMEAGILPNNRNCDNVHHINGNPEDNRPANLLPVFSGDEHDTLEKLRKDKTKKREYKKMVKRIRELNSEELFKIPHPDYPSDEYNHYFMLLNKKGYLAYKQGKEIPLDCIRRESVETVKSEMKAE